MPGRIPLSFSAVENSRAMCSPIASSSAPPEPSAGPSTAGRRRLDRLLGEYRPRRRQPESPHRDRRRERLRDRERHRGVKERYPDRGRVRQHPRRGRRPRRPGRQRRRRYPQRRRRPRRADRRERLRHHLGRRRRRPPDRRHHRPRCQHRGPDAIRSEWTSANDYDTRIFHIKYGQGGLNGSYTLKVGQTVSNSDNAVDVLSGDTDRDWFFWDSTSDSATPAGDEQSN